MSDTTIGRLLPDTVLEDFRTRAARYDAENAFFAEDLAALRTAGYLAAPVPKAMGGAGLDLTQLVAAQRRLAAYAPATALGVNMHLVWVQVARFLHDRGIRTLDWVLEEAVAGEVFAFGISEPGNDAVLMDAQSRAVRDGEGYLVSGTKIFTTLSPVWTRLGVHARAEGQGEDPVLVFAFVRRDGGTVAEGTVTHPGTWNPLGMRATQSWTTQLERVRVFDRDVAARIAPYDGSHPLVLAIFSSFSLLTAAVYAGIGDRALELATVAANRLVPGADGAGGTDGGGGTEGTDGTDGSEGTGGAGAPRLDDPDVASRLTAAVLEHRESLDALELLARDVDDRRTREDWFLALAAARNRVTDEARRAVDVAMRLVGAQAYGAESELARLYRDVLAGMFHPSSSRALARTVRGGLLAN